LQLCLIQIEDNSVEKKSSQPLKSRKPEYLVCYSTNIDLTFSTP